MNRAASEQRKAAAIPRSFSFAKPRRGVRFWISSNRSGVFKFVFASMSVYTNPGFKLLTRMPYGPRSRERLLVRPLTPLLHKVYA